MLTQKVKIWILFFLLSSLSDNALSQINRISLHLSQATPQEAFRLLREKTGKNFVLTQKAQKASLLTLSLDSVTADEALQAVLEVSSLKLKQSGSLFIISTKDESPNPPSDLVTQEALPSKAISKMRPQLIRLKHMSPEHAVNLFSNLAERITPAPSRQAILVTATEENLTRLQELLAKLDVPQYSVLLEVKIIQATSDHSQTVGLSPKTQVTLSKNPAPKSGVVKIQTGEGRMGVDTHPTSHLHTQIEGVFAETEGNSRNTETHSLRTQDQVPATLDFTIKERFQRIETSEDGKAIPKTELVELQKRIQITPKVQNSETVLLQISIVTTTPLSTGTTQIPDTESHSFSAQIAAKNAQSIRIAEANTKNPQTNKQGIPGLTLLKTEDLGSRSYLLQITPRISLP